MSDQHDELRLLTADEARSVSDRAVDVLLRWIEVEIARSVLSSGNGVRLNVAYMHVGAFRELSDRLTALGYEVRQDHIHMVVSWASNTTEQR